MDAVVDLGAAYATKSYCVIYTLVSIAARSLTLKTWYVTTLSILLKAALTSQPIYKPSAIPAMTKKLMPRVWRGVSKNCKPMVSGHHAPSRLQKKCHFWQKVKNINMVTYVFDKKKEGFC